MQQHRPRRPHPPARGERIPSPPQRVPRVVDMPRIRKQAAGKRPALVLRVGLEARALGLGHDLDGEADHEQRSAQHQRHLREGPVARQRRAQRLRRERQRVGAVGRRVVRRHDERRAHVEALLPRPRHPPCVLGRRRRRHREEDEPVGAEAEGIDGRAGRRGCAGR